MEILFKTKSDYIETPDGRMKLMTYPCNRPFTAKHMLLANLRLQFDNDSLTLRF